MTQFVSDNFDGIAGTDITAHNANWVSVTGATGTASLDGTRLRQTSSSVGAAMFYRSDAVPAAADYSVSTDVYVSSNTGTGAVGIAARVSDSAQTFYQARVLNGTGVQLQRSIAGSVATLGTYAMALANGQIVALKLEMVGSTINVYVDGSSTPDISATDANIAAAGYPGFRFLNLSGGQLRLDDFSADEGGSTQSRVVTPTGGFTLAGAAPLARSTAWPPAGGLVLSGLAPVSTGAGSQTRVVTPTGGFAISGAAAIVRSRRYTASGGITFAGSSPYRNSGFVAQMASIARRRSRPRVITTR